MYTSGSLRFCLLKQKRSTGMYVWRSTKRINSDIQNNLIAKKPKTVQIGLRKWIYSLPQANDYFSEENTCSKVKILVYSKQTVRDIFGLFQRESNSSQFPRFMVVIIFTLRLERDLISQFAISSGFWTANNSQPTKGNKMFHFAFVRPNETQSWGDGPWFWLNMRDYMPNMQLTPCGLIASVLVLPA